MTSACRIRSAWSMSSQKTIVLSSGSVALRNSVTFCGDELRPLLEDEGAVEVRLVVDAVLDHLAVLVDLALLGPPAGRSLSRSMRTTLYGARKPSSMPCLSE